MLFTPADFIILGVVLVVLLAYRQLDRGNRSLEKVKKYADKLQGDLSAYVDHAVRQALFWDTVENIQVRNSDLSPEDAQALADEAVAEIRANPT